MFFRGSIMEKHIMEWLFCSRTWLRNLGMFKTARIRQYKWTQSILQCWHHLCKADFQPTTHHDCPACPQYADLRTIGLCPLHWKQLGVKPKVSATPAEQRMRHFTGCIFAWGTHFHQTLGSCKSTQYWSWVSARGRDRAGAISYEKMLHPHKKAQIRHLLFPDWCWSHCFCTVNLTLCLNLIRTTAVMLIYLIFLPYGVNS